MQDRSRIEQSTWLGILVLLVVSALTYLPLVTQLGYTNDDWYLMYGAHVQGPDYFAPAFERDRPLRAFVLGPAYALFGDAVLPYHLSAYGFRLLGAVTLFWLLAKLWPRNHTPNLLISLFFLIYPGFLAQVNPIDYQSQIISLWAAMASLALTVKALISERRAAKILWASLSIVLAWIYLGLVEYFLGLEVLRLLCVYLVVAHRGTFALRQKWVQTLRDWIPFSIGPLVFLIWRLFFFSSERGATDVGLQFGQLLASPVQTGLWWLARMTQDTLNVIFLAWGVPLYNLGFNLRLSETWIGFGLSFVVAGAAIAYFSLDGVKSGEEQTRQGWREEMLWVGLVSAIAGLIPVILVNRHVEFMSFSRYALASSAGGAMVLVAILHFLGSPRLRLGLIGLLTVSAVLTHYANAANSVRDTETVRNFWWQVSWRIPQLRPGTTLAVYYPAPIQEDYFIWGAANMLYYPERQTVQPVDAPVSAVILTSANVSQIISGKGQDEPNRRNIHMVQDYGNVLVISQPSRGACVRVLNGDNPELSVIDDHRLMLIAPSSKIENVILEEGHAQPLEALFGPEPDHGWCYYYQQADIARYLGDWEAIPDLHEEALKNGYYPEDSVEWMPFVQAYAVLGDVEQTRNLGRIVSANQFLQVQACRIMTSFMETENVKQEIQSLVQEIYCP
jgi:hypothetical protein